MFAPSFFASRDVPIFVIGGSDDLFVRFPGSGEWVYANTNEPHVAVEIVGGQHMGFTDIAVDDEVPQPRAHGSDVAPRRHAPGLRRPQARAYTEPEGGPTRSSRSRTSTRSSSRW